MAHDLSEQEPRKDSWHGVKPSVETEECLACGKTRPAGELMDDICRPCWTTRAELDGHEVTLFRSETDGVMVVQIDTSDAGEGNQWPSGAPKLRVGVNDDYSDVGPDGTWVEPWL